MHTSDEKHSDHEEEKVNLEELKKVCTALNTRQQDYNQQVKQLHRSFEEYQNEKHAMISEAKATLKR